MSLYPPSDFEGASKTLFFVRVVIGLVMYTFRKPASKTHSAWLILSPPWLPDKDSNLDKKSQNLLCYRYTIGQSTVPILQKNERMSRAVAVPRNRFINRFLNGIRIHGRQLRRNNLSKRKNFGASARITIKRNVNRKTACLLLTLLFSPFA